MASRYDLIDHNTTSATTTPTKQNATRTPAIRHRRFKTAGGLFDDQGRHSCVHARPFR